LHAVPGRHSTSLPRVWASRGRPRWNGSRVRSTIDRRSHPLRIPGHPTWGPGRYRSGSLTNPSATQNLSNLNDCIGEPVDFPGSAAGPTASQAADGTPPARWTLRRPATLRGGQTCGEDEVCWSSRPLVRLSMDRGRPSTHSNLGENGQIARKSGPNCANHYVAHR
jgi:hypothetical protein